MVRRFLLYHQTEEGLLWALEIFFRTCEQRNLKISDLKSQLFVSTVNWCGRIIDADGVRFYHRNHSSLRDMHLPRTAAELCEYVNFLQWMANGIPNFAARVPPLRAILEEAYQISGSRTKKPIQRIQFSELSWCTEHEAVFHSLQEPLWQTVKLAYRDVSKALCAYTDASDALWSGVVSQCDPEDLNKELEEQRHNPVAFLGAAFKESAEWWTAFEKEVFAIFQVFQKLGYFFLSEEETQVTPTTGTSYFLTLLPWRHRWEDTS